jgi:hypothetical protein
VKLKRSFKTEKPTIIDVWCGDSHFIQMLQVRIPQGKYYTINKAFPEDRVKELNERSNIIQYLNSYKSFEQLNQLADVVLLLDIVEHIDGDLNFFKISF